MTTPITPVRFGPVWRRLLAFLFDGAFFFTLFFLAIRLIVWIFRAQSNMPPLAEFFGFLFFMGSLFLYYAYCWHRFGASPARLMLKLRIIDMDDPGRIGLSWRKSILRFFFGYWLNNLFQGTGFWLMFLSPRRQNWYERVSHTVTVYVPDRTAVMADVVTIPPEKKRPIIFGILLATSVLVMVIQLSEVILMIFPPE